MQVSVVIPAWNEAESIGTVVAELRAALPKAELIVMDGGSRDATVAIAQAAGARALAQAQRGYGAACREGAAAAAAGTEIVAFLDGDGSDVPAALPSLLAPIAAGTQDFVIGSRVKGVREPGSLSPHQVWAGWMAGRAMGALYGVAYSDMGPMRAIRRESLAAIDMREAGYGWNLEMQMRAARAGLRILELPVPHRRRLGGESKVAGSLSGTVKASWHLARTFARLAAAPAPKPIVEAAR